MRTSDQTNRMFCDSLLKHTGLDGKTILDIGCGNGSLVKYIASHYQPNYVTGIEPKLSEWGVNEERGINYSIVQGNAHNLSFEDNSFDLIVTYSTFEHILDIEKALVEIKRVLRPYGMFYTEFMPIWTSVIGHHFIDEFSGYWDYNNLLLIPPYSHLYMSRQQMHDCLYLNSDNHEIIEKIITHIYESEDRKSVV